MSDANFDPVYKELAQRAVIREIAQTGTLLVKADSLGRLYEEKTVAEVLGSGVSGGKVYESETFVLTETDISNKYVQLGDIPADATEIELNIQNAPAQYYGEDFKQDETYKKRITWENMALDGDIILGDKITINYTKEL